MGKKSTPSTPLLYFSVKKKDDITLNVRLPVRGLDILLNTTEKSDKGEDVGTVIIDFYNSRLRFSIRSTVRILY